MRCGVIVDHPLFDLIKVTRGQSTVTSASLLSCQSSSPGSWSQFICVCIIFIVFSVELEFLSSCIILLNIIFILNYSYSKLQGMSLYLNIYQVIASQSCVSTFLHCFSSLILADQIISACYRSEERL